MSKNQLEPGQHRMSQEKARSGDRQKSNLDKQVNAINPEEALKNKVNQIVHQFQNEKKNVLNPQKNTLNTANKAQICTPIKSEQVIKKQREKVMMSKDQDSNSTSFSLCGCWSKISQGPTQLQRYHRQLRKAQIRETQQKIKANYQIGLGVTLVKRLDLLRLALKEEKYQKVNLLKQIEALESELSVKKQSMNNKEQQQIVLFRYEVAKYFYYAQKFKQACRDIQWLLKQQNLLDRFYFSVLALKLFYFISKYCQKINKQQTTTNDFAKMVELFKSLQRQECGSFGNKRKKQMLLLAYTLLYHFKLCCRQRFKGESQQQQAKLRDNLQQNEFWDHFAEERFIGSSLLLEINQPRRVGLEFKSEIVYEQNYFVDEERKKSLQRKSSQKEMLYTLRNICQKLSLKEAISKKVIKEKQIESYFLVDRDDIQQIIESKADDNESLVIRTPFINVKAIYIEADISKNWIGLFKNKQCLKLTKKQCALLWKLCFGVCIFVPSNSFSGEQFELEEIYPVAKRRELRIFDSILQVESQTHSKVFTQESSIIKKKSRGLKNLGNTCYINSVMQCLHKSRFFNTAFAKFIQDLSDKGRPLAKLTTSYHQMLKQLSKQYEKKAFNPIEIKNIVAKDNNLFENYQQNDAVQFLSSFLEILSQQLNVSKIKKKMFQISQKLQDEDMLRFQKMKDESRCQSIVEDTFNGRYKTTYECKICRNQYRLFQKFKVHYVPIPKPVDKRLIGSVVSEKPYKLLQCLKDFQKGDLMEGSETFSCDKCHKDTPSIKSMTIFQANDIFIIALKRFHAGEKNDRKIQIPMELKPSQFITKFNVSLYPNKMYRLYAAIIHYGQVNGGHYMAICFDSKQSSWKSYNDSFVESVSLSDLNSHLSNAYALFYQFTCKDQVIQSKLMLAQSM